MSLLHPRATYRRAPNEDSNLIKGYHIELSPIDTSHSNKSSTRKLVSNDITEIAPSATTPGDNVRSSGTSSRRNIFRFQGWRVGALSAAGLAGFSFLVNLAVVSWLRSRDKGAVLVEVFKGSCSQVQTFDIWVHLAINALSTLLLGGSNYCMQCLCAPTRKDVDREHARAMWRDIGVPSVRNFRKVLRSKAWLWWLLGLSSVPLHLM